MYGIFLTIELARSKSIIKNELEYDLMWEQGKTLYNAFLESKFNDDTKGEYECVSDFLDNYKIVNSPQQKGFDRNMVIQREIQNSGFNIVTCPDCGSVNLHYMNATRLTCGSCGFTSSHMSDFPDLF